MKNDVSVIIPFLNEEENILDLVEQLNQYFSDHTITSEVIFVDDGSNDNSVNLLKEASHNFYQPKIIKLSKNFGSHAAIRAGLLNATGSYIIFLPADLQDPLEMINIMFKKIIEGYDVVLAQRESTQVNLIDKYFSRFYSKMIQKFAVNTYPDKGVDLVMINHKIQSELNKNIESNSSVFLQILTIGFRQAVISYHKNARKAGKSKWTLTKKIKLFIDSFVAFSYLPIRFVTLGGISFFALGFIFSFYLIIRKIFYNDLEQGWPALISILMIGFGVTNISLGIIAEYLWRTLDASRNRPAFVIDEIIEIQK